MVLLPVRPLRSAIRRGASPAFRYAAALAAALFWAAPSLLGAQAASGPLDEACEAVRRRFYDRSSLGRDWERACDAARARAGACESPEALHGVVNALLGSLRASHTVLIEGAVHRDNFQAEFDGKPSLRPGLELGRFPGGTFVTAVYDGGPAARAALEVGEQVVQVNRLPPEDSRRVVDAGTEPGMQGIPHQFLCVEDREPVDLLVQAADSRATRRRVRIRPAPVSLVEATRASARIVEVDGRKLGILHPWHFMHWGIVRAMRDALEGPLAEADGLVLDLRGRGGQIPVMWGALALFSPRRDGTRLWNKPAVALVDGTARSAKEVFAWHWKQMGVGPLVGQRTAGAVLGSTFVPLSDGSILHLAVSDVSRLTGGVRLEGGGVEPDVPVEWTIPFCQGRDAILEKGLAVLAGEIRKEARGARFYGFRGAGFGF